MHLLFIASWYPNRLQPALGNFIREHARAAALKHTVTVVYACSDENLPEGKTEPTQQVEGNLTELVLYYGKVRSGIPVLSHIRKSRTYRKAIQAGIERAVRLNGKPDILHLQVIWPAAVAVLPLLDIIGAPLVITEHWSGYLPEDGNYKGMLMKSFSRKIAARARVITVVSGRMEKAMHSHGLGANFVRLPNTVDTNIFRPEKRNRKDDCFLLLHVSMLVDREKNISGMLRVMKSLEQENIRLEIIGEGPERESHEALARSLGLYGKSVFFYGYRKANEIAAAMQHADALLMFSNFEGMPVTIIEAQCCGLPVIATRTGAIPEMVGSEEGLLAEPGDETGLKKAILEMREKISSYRPETICKKAAEQYSAEAVSKKLDSIYHSALEK